MNKNEFIDSLLRRVKNKSMKEETKQSLSDFFANHPERNEVYLSGEKLFYNRGTAESYGVPVVKYTRQEVEAMQKASQVDVKAGDGLETKDAEQPDTEEPKGEAGQTIGETIPEADNKDKQPAESKKKGKEE